MQAQPSRPLPELRRRTLRLMGDWVGAYVLVRREMQNRLMRIPRELVCRVNRHHTGRGPGLATDPCPVCRLPAAMGGVSEQDLFYIGHPDPGVDVPALRAGDGLTRDDDAHFARERRALRLQALTHCGLREIREGIPSAMVHYLGHPGPSVRLAA